MDPEANYAEQAQLYGSKDPDDRERLKELRSALRDWVAGGGFRPKGYVGPSWKPAKKPRRSPEEIRAEKDRKKAEAKRTKEEQRIADRRAAEDKITEHERAINDREADIRSYERVRAEAKEKIDLERVQIKRARSEIAKLKTKIKKLS